MATSDWGDKGADPPRSSLIFPSTEWKERVKVRELLNEMRGEQKQPEEVPLPDDEDEWEDYDEDRTVQNIEYQLDDVAASLQNIRLELSVLKSGKKPAKKSSDSRFIFSAKPESIILAVQSLGWLVNPEDRRMFEQAVLKQQRDLRASLEKKYGKPKN
jgi:hypothetical protein